MTDQHIENCLRARMPDSWDRMNDIQKLACTIAYSIGFDDGFQIAAAAERGIIAVQRKLNELESAPAPTSKDLASTNRPGADPFEDPLRMILGTLAGVSGSGYEGRGE